MIVIISTMLQKAGLETYLKIGVLETGGNVEERKPVPFAMETSHQERFVSRKTRRISYER